MLRTERIRNAFRLLGPAPDCGKRLHPDLLGELTTINFACVYETFAVREESTQVVLVSRDTEEIYPLMM
jgi:plasmid stabilization system protein ParE